MSDEEDNVSEYKSINEVLRKAHFHSKAMRAIMYSSKYSLNGEIKPSGVIG